MLTHPFSLSCCKIVRSGNSTRLETWSLVKEVRRHSSRRGADFVEAKDSLCQTVQHDVSGGQADRLRFI
jgi:hypothetical protein